jgi:hypothetical protein
MRFVTIQLRDGRCTTKDIYTDTMSGAYRTREEADINTAYINRQYEEERKILASCGLMLSD